MTVKDIYKTLIGGTFAISMMVTGCSIDHAFDSRENTITWLGVFAVTIITAILLGRSE
jgi:hypothetical protein